MEIPGHGPILADLLADTAGRTTYRRLFTRDGVIIGGDSGRRKFDGNLARCIRARDGNRCREPYCDAPIRHVDHIERWADGGATSFDGGRGTCEFHNEPREKASNWKLRRIGSTIGHHDPDRAQLRVRRSASARQLIVPR